MEIVEFPLDDGGVVFVEVLGSTGDNTLGRAGALTDRVERKATSSFKAALSVARHIADAVADQFRGLTPPPDEVEVTFGMKVTGGVNAKFIVAGSKSNLSVRILWGREVTERATEPLSGDTGP